MSAPKSDLPGAGLQPHKMPGHWLLARLGKRVLRPGGLALTRQMVEALAVASTDHVVEFAPGFGVTARQVLAGKPATYTAVEADPDAAHRVRQLLSGEGRRCVVGRAEETGLPDGTATVVYGEAMLTMQTAARKRQIVREACRLLTPGGRYGIHELCLTPDDLDATTKDAVQSDLSEAIHVGARPLTVPEWKDVLETEGLVVKAEATAPMHLLRLHRLIQDEGLARTIRIVWNAIRDHVARRRVLAMRRTFQRHESHMGAVMLVAAKPGAASDAEQPARDT